MKWVVIGSSVDDALMYGEIASDKFFLDEKSVALYKTWIKNIYTLYGF